MERYFIIMEIDYENGHRCATTMYLKLIAPTISIINEITALYGEILTRLLLF